MRKNLFVIGFVTVLVVFGLFLASGRVNNLLFRQGLQQTPATPSLSEENSGIQMATILVFGDSGTGGAVQKKLAELMESVSADAILHTLAEQNKNSKTILLAFILTTSERNCFRLQVITII